MIRESSKETVPKRFRTILADPPWEHQQQNETKGAIKHYQLMSLERIKAMPVVDLAEDDAHLWLWCTNASLRDGYDVAEAWGFTTRSVLTWVKFRLGLGHFLRNSTEHVLFGTRGRAPVQFRSQPTWINAPVEEHSRKPDELYSVIERVSPGPYLELFARRRPPSTRGWFIWGNEVDADISIPGYAVPSDQTSGGTGRETADD